VIDQFGTSSTLKYVVSVEPSTVLVNVPAPSLPVIVIRYWSTGLSPGTAGCQMEMIVLLVPCGFGFAQ